jgi:hypothetical protein
LNLKKLAVIVFLTLLLSMTFVILNPTLAQTTEEQRLKAETLLNILDTVNASASEAFSRLDAQNITVPQNAETKYNEGITHAEEAINLMHAEKYNEASSEAIEAMKSFKETLIILQEASPAEPTETEITAEKAISLRANITRAYEYVERLENLTAKAATVGYNTTGMENRLASAKNHLENATKQLDGLNLDVASEELNAARAFFGEMKSLYDRLINLVKASNTERYLEAAEARVIASKDNITNSALPQQNKTDAINALNNSETNLEKARELIQSGMVDDAVEELEEAKRWEDESRKYLTSVTATPNQFGAVDKNLSRIESMASK